MTLSRASVLVTLQSVLFACVLLTIAGARRDASFYFMACVIVCMLFVSVFWSRFGAISSSGLLVLFHRPHYLMLMLFPVLLYGIHLVLPTPGADLFRVVLSTSLQSWFAICCFAAMASLSMSVFRRGQGMDQSSLAGGALLFLLINLISLFPGLDLSEKVVGLNSFASNPLMVSPDLVSSINTSNALLIFVFCVFNVGVRSYVFRVLVATYFLVTLSMAALACISLFLLISIVRSLNFLRVIGFGVLSVTVILPIVVSLQLPLVIDIAPSYWGALNGRGLIWSEAFSAPAPLHAIAGWGFFGHVPAGVYSSYSFMFPSSMGIQGMHNTWLQLYFDLGFIGLFWGLLYVTLAILQASRRMLLGLISVLPLFAMEGMLSPYAAEGYVFTILLLHSCIVGFDVPKSQGFTLEPINSDAKSL